MFDKLAPGAHSTVTGLVTLLAIAKSMASLRENITKSFDPKKNVLFILFNGVSHYITLIFVYRLNWHEQCLWALIM